MFTQGSRASCTAINDAKWLWLEQQYLGVCLILYAEVKKMDEHF